jgi:threonine dehydrogenase-like Zn-dependent dehydrogenase
VKALQKFGDGKAGMGIREVPEPSVGPNDLLIEVGAVGICGSDLHIWRDEKEHRRPVTVGHEFSGTVIAKGSDVGDRWAFGDRICGDLETLEGRVGTHVDGACAPLLALPRQLAHKLPDSLTFAEGALIEQVTCMSHAAMRRARIMPGDVVVITGPGPIGLTMLQIVRLFTPLTVIVTGLRSDVLRLEKAKQLGADHVAFSEEDPVEMVLQLTEDQGADVVLDCSGGEAAITQATRMVKNGGWITIIGLWGSDLRVNLDRIPYNNLTVRGSWGWDGMEYQDQAVRMAAGWHSWERALKIMAMGKIDLAPIVTRNIALEEWRDAYEALEAKREIKVMMYPNEQHMPRDPCR